MLMNLTNFLEMAKAQTSTPLKNCGGSSISMDQSPIPNRTDSPVRPTDSRTVSPQMQPCHVSESRPIENGHLSDPETSDPIHKDHREATVTITTTSTTRTDGGISNHTKSPSGSRKRKLIPTEIPSKNQSLKQCLLETLSDIIPYHRNLSLRLLMTYTIDNNQSECILIDEILNKNQTDKLDLIRHRSPNGESTLSSVPSSLLNSVLFKKEDQTKSSRPNRSSNNHADSHVLDLSVRLDSPESANCDEDGLTNKSTDSEMRSADEKIGKLCTLYDNLRMNSMTSTDSNRSDLSSVSSAYTIPTNLLSATTAPTFSNAVISTATTTPASEAAAARPGAANVNTSTITQKENNNNSMSTISESKDTDTKTTTSVIATTTTTATPILTTANENPCNELLKNEFPLIDASSLLTLLPLLQHHHQQQNQTVSNFFNSSPMTTTTNNSTMNSNLSSISNAASLLLNQLCGTSIETTPISLTGLTSTNTTTTTTTTTNNNNSNQFMKSLEQHNILNSAPNSIIQPTGFNGPSIIGFPLFNPFLTDQLNAVQTLLPSGSLLGTTATLTSPNFTSLNLGPTTLFNLKDKNANIETINLMPTTKSFNQPVASLINQLSVYPTNPISVRTFSQFLNQSNPNLATVNLTASTPTKSSTNLALFTNSMNNTDDEPMTNGQILNDHDLNGDQPDSSNPLIISTNSNVLNSIITSLSTPSSTVVPTTTPATIAEAVTSSSSSTMKHISIRSFENERLNTIIANHTTNTSQSNSNTNDGTNHFLFGRRLTHSRRFTCNQCRRNFASLADLNRHTLETHNSFRCTICSAHFTQRSNLQRHSLKHVGFKPFTCNLCKKEYYRKDHLVRHIEVTHPNHDPKMNITVHLTSSECLDYLDRLNSGKQTPSPSNEDKLSVQNYTTTTEDDDNDVNGDDENECAKLQVAEDMTETAEDPKV